MPRVLTTALTDTQHCKCEGEQMMGLNYRDGRSGQDSDAAMLYRQQLRLHRRKHTTALWQGASVL